eukprot:3198105-Amphidinium_carterae.1
MCPKKGASESEGEWLCNVQLLNSLLHNERTAMDNLRDSETSLSSAMNRGTCQQSCANGSRAPVSDCLRERGSCSDPCEPHETCCHDFEQQEIKQYTELRA